jgi:hypothetical protein
MDESDLYREEPNFLDGTNEDEKLYFLEKIHEMLTGWHYTNLEHFLIQFKITFSDVSELYASAQDLLMIDFPTSGWNKYLESLKVKKPHEATMIEWRFN